LIEQNKVLKIQVQKLTS